MSDMKCKWVKNIYTGEKAKKVLELASMGIGYITLNAGKDGNQVEATVAFRIAADKQISVSMVELNEYDSEKMDKLLLRRQGMPGVKQVDFIIKLCGDCGNPFTVTCDTDWLCDTCAGILAPNPHHLSRKELEGRNWEDRKIKKQWQESYKKSENTILNKCKGSNYYN